MAIFNSYVNLPEGNLKAMIDPYPGKIGMALKCHQNLSVELLSKSTQFLACLLWKIRDAEEASIYLSHRIYVCYIWYPLVN